MVGAETRRNRCVVCEAIQKDVLYITMVGREHRGMDYAWGDVE